MAVQQYFAAVGRRKTSVARVRLVPGTGEIVVNGKPLDTYFGGSIWTAQVQEPFQTINQNGRYNADVKVERCRVASSFGEMDDAAVVIISRAAHLPATLRVRLDLNGAGAMGGSVDVTGIHEESS